jgi:ABC-2 type transport system ATP-binding protein
MENSILKTASLSKTYKKDVVALSGFNLVLKRGTILGLLGPNGAGKSTFVNILANIVKRDSGEIYLFDEEITENSYKYKSKCGFVLENPVYIEKLTILEYLEFAGEMYGLSGEETDERIVDLVDIFELGSKKDKWIESCSKGMKKKVSIATALLHNPQLLVLDEPFSDLDLVALGRLKDIMHKAKDTGKAILIASHNIQELENICDEFAIIKEGKILFQQSFREIRKEIEKNNLDDFENFVYRHIDKNRFEKSLSWL